MKKIIGLFIVLFTVQISIAQEVCGTDYYLEQELLKNPHLLDKSPDQSVGVNHKTGSRGVKIIPLVFHIFHDNEVGNISYEQILSAVDMLNEDFRRTNTDTTNTRGIFKPFAADTEIEFRLAQVDPDGNCTNGVVRINDPNYAYDGDDDVKPISRWPYNEYFNIWVVNNIESSGVQGIILGYARFPGWGGLDRYGVIIRNDRVGRTGTANSGDRTLTHEVGHCLNLYHTFQSGCGSNCSNSGDNVCDTPPVNNSTQPCDKYQNQCANDAQGPSPYVTDVVDQIENYMSYNDCQNMFTLGQKDRMEDAFDDHSFLTQLVSGSNLVATGVNNTNPGICKAEFEAQSQQVCVGQPVQFTDFSFHNPKTHLWNFEGADVVSSSDKNPVVTYSIPGIYKVSLTVSDSNQTVASTTKSDFITVISSFRHTAPFTEGFEEENNLLALNWFGDIHSNNFGWFLDPTNGYSGNHSLRGAAYGNEGKMSVTSIAYDASNLKSGTLQFKHAYAPRQGESSNYIRVYVSGNCGEEWKVLTILGGGSLKTTATRNSAYVSPNTADWKSNSFAIPTELLTENLRFKFEYNVNGGNNIFIDNINLSGSVNRNLKLRFPYNGVSNVSSNPTLNWNAVDTIDYYVLELDTDTTFSSADYESHQLSYISSSSNNLDTEWALTNLVHGQTYYWKVTGSLNGVDTTISETWSFKVDSAALGINTTPNQSFKVTAYPNPSREVVYLNVKSQSQEDVEIVMFDVTGNRVKTIFSGELIETETVFTINRENLSNGIYLIQTISKNGMDSQRIVLE
jgi:PKD repeat protein